MLLLFETDYKLDVMLKTLRGKLSLAFDSSKIQNALFCLAYQLKRNKRKGKMSTKPLLLMLPKIETWKTKMFCDLH